MKFHKKSESLLRRENFKVHEVPLPPAATGTRQVQGLELCSICCSVGSSLQVFFSRD